jgi:hypothetical protein
MNSSQYLFLDFILQSLLDNQQWERLLQYVAAWDTTPVILADGDRENNRLPQHQCFRKGKNLIPIIEQEHYGVHRIRGRLIVILPQIAILVGVPPPASQTNADPDILVSLV